MKQAEAEASISVALGLKFASELGYMIALPAVIFGFGGAYLDKMFHTTPLFIVIGLALAFTISMFGVIRKVKEIVAATPDSKKKKQPLSPLNP